MRLSETCSTKQPSKIRNRDFVRQIKDFSGLSFGRIYPTDIDGFLDFNDEVFIFIEAKHGDGTPKGGQKLALERLCDACAIAGKNSIVLVANHDDDGDIDIGALFVSNIRFNGKWRTAKREITVRDAIIEYRRFCERKSRGAQIR